MSETMSLMEILQEHLSSKELKLPVFPPLVLELQQMLSSDDARIDEISRKISSDQVLASQLLRVANSAFFSGLSKVTTINDAVMRLGTRQVMELVFLTTQQQQYQSKDTFITPFLPELWQHASMCAVGSKWLAEKLGFRKHAQEAFLAGLLHDIGKLFLLKVLETIHSSGKHRLDLSRTVLNEVLETMHTTQGSALLQSWNLPEIYCDVVRRHHEEGFSGNNVVLGIVRLVDTACYKLGIGSEQQATIVLAATAEARYMEVSELRAAELEIMLEDSVQAGSHAVASALQ